MQHGGGHHQHDVGAVVCGVLTISDTRTPESDRSGQRIRELLQAAGHRITQYQVLKDDPDLIARAIAHLAADIEVLIMNGGTGLAQRDTTFEAVNQLLDKHISGFGELFRVLSYEEIGAAAMLSRACAGVVGHRVLFSLPGSTAAVELAMTKLILPTLGHVAGLVRGSA